MNIRVSSFGMVYNNFLFKQNEITFLDPKITI